MRTQNQILWKKLRPGETSIVSWKKLVKDPSKVSGQVSAPEPLANAHPALESRLALVSAASIASILISSGGLFVIEFCLRIISCGRVA